MPDWYVQRNTDDSSYPYSVRLGGCEYSLTEEEFFELAQAFETIGSLQGPGEVQSEDYQDLVVASTPKYEELKSLLGLKAQPARRF
jgi:hypothetical protein